MGMLNGKVVLITGSERDSADAAAKLFAVEGASVAMSDLDPYAAEATAVAIRSIGAGLSSLPAASPTLPFPDN